MTIKVLCECGKTLCAPESAAGRKGRCPTCNRVILVPTPKEEQDTATVASVPEGEAETAVRAGAIVGDASPSDLAATSRLFREHGYNVLYAGGNANDLVEKVRDLRPDVVMLDIKLDGTNGFQVIRTLKDPINPRNRDIWQTLFVMSTSELSGRDKQYALSLGVEIFVQKPFTPVQVFPRLNRRLQKRHSGG
jgi:twitching motility two-component system response regulator PilH